MRTWRRKFLHVCIFLLLGAIINIAVAWGCVYWSNPFAGPLGRLVDDTTHDLGISGVGVTWHYWVTKRPGVVLVQGLIAHEHGQEPSQRLDVFHSEVPGWSRLNTIALDDANALGIAIEDARGWPWVALRSETNMLNEGKGRYSGIVGGGIAITPNEPDPRFYRVIPLRPIWPGFAINTIFYAAIMWMLVAVPGYIIRRRRIKRGVCVRCAYDLRGRGIGTQAGTCPECGTEATTIA